MIPNTNTASHKHFNRLDLNKDRDRPGSAGKCKSSGRSRKMLPPSIKKQEDQKKQKQANAALKIYI